MKRLYKLSTLAMMAIVFALASGCQTLKETQTTAHSMMESVGLQPPKPASHFACAWQNTLQQLPDPTKSGRMVSGLPGQMFLFTEDYKPATPVGDLTISVEDDTPRPQGSPKHPAEVWHFTKDKLEKMIAVDERFGKNFLLFVPWPDNWRDVSRIRVSASYQQPNGIKTLYCQPSMITLDFTGGTYGTGLTSRVSTPSMGVPDPNAVLKQMQNQSQMAQSPLQQPWPGQQPIQQTGYQMPIQQPTMPQQNPMPQQPWPGQQTGYQVPLQPTMPQQPAMPNGMQMPNGI